MRLRRVATLALMLAAPCPIAAQSVPAVARDSADSARARARARALAPVVVTVVRAPLSLEQSPLAIAVATTGEIRSARPGLALDEALRALPGVHVDNRHNYAVGERISIRGFGARSQFGVRGIRVLVDGIPATLPDGQTNLNNIDLGVLGRAEVIRGPASAIYGNAAGGVVMFTSEPPAPENISGRVRAFGGGGSTRVQSVLSGSKAPLSYLVSASRLDVDGARAHDKAGVTIVTARVGATVSAGDFDVTLSAVDYEAENPGALTAALLRADRKQAFANNVVQRTGETGQQAQAGARWTRQVGAGSLEVSGHALARDIDSPIPPRIIALARSAEGGRVAYRTRDWALSRRVSAGGSIGGELQGQHDDRQNFVNDSGRRAARVLDQRERVTAAGPFALLWADIAHRVSLLAAVRHDRQRFAVSDRLVSSTNPDDSGERTMRAWSPSAGISLEVANGIRLYGNAASAFETPTTSELANRPTGAGGFNPDLQPQRTHSIEGGLNARFGSLATAQASLYRAMVRDALAPFEVPGAPGRQFFRNTGRAAHRGGEIWVHTASARNISARAAYSYVNARFEDGTTGAAALAGLRLPGISPHRFDGTLEAKPHAGLLPALHLALDSRYVSATPADDANRVYSPPYAVSDVRVWYAPSGAQWLSPFAGASNVLDRDYNTSVVINAAGGRYFEPGPGRVFYVGIEGRWAKASPRAHARAHALALQRVDDSRAKLARRRVFFAE